MSISKTMSFTVSIILNVFLPFSMAVLDLHKPLDFPPSGLPDTFVSVQSQFSLNYGSVILSFLGIVLLVTLMKSGPKSNTKTLNTIPKAKGLFTIRIPIIDGIYGMMRARRDGIKILEDLDSECGKLYELPFAFSTVTMVADLSVVQAILSSTQPEHLNRPRFSTEILRDVFHDGLFTSDYKTWSVHRKILNRSFTHKSLQHYMVFMNEHSKMLAKSYISAAEANNKTGNCCVDGDRVPELLYCYAFKTIAQIIMGTDAISEAKSEELTQKFNAFKNLMIEKLMNPFSFYLKKRKYDQLYEYVNDFISNTIQNYQNVFELERKNYVESENVDDDDEEEDEESIGVKPFRCMIEELICSEMTSVEIYDQVSTFLGAGHETTVASIKLFLFNLALNPEHQTICRQEIDAMLDEKLGQRSRDDFNVSLNLEDMQSLKYLERCIMESARVINSTPVFLRRLDAPLKVNDNLEFPAGTNFGINVWQIHKDKEQYPNPEKFDPDRFLPENVLKRHAYSYIPFSLGVKNCIGFKLATLHIKIIAVWILRNFEISTTDKLENVKLLFGITTVPERNHNIILRRRILME